MTQHLEPTTINQKGLDLIFFRMPYQWEKWYHQDRKQNSERDLVDQFASNQFDCGCGDE